MNEECGEFLCGVLSICTVENHSREVPKSLMALVNESNSLGFKTQLH